MENTKKEVRCTCNNEVEALKCFKNCDYSYGLGELSSLPSTEERKTAEDDLRKFIVKNVVPGAGDVLKQLSETRREAEEFKDKYCAALETIDELHPEIFKLQSQLSEASQQTEAMAKEIEELKEQMEVVVARFTNIQVNLEYDLSEAKKEIERLKDKEIRGDRMIVKLEHEKTVLQSELSAIRERVEGANIELKRLQEATGLSSLKTLQKLLSLNPTKQD